ncbi:MAG: hypothetical protein RL722_3029 [Pseudomonadota bacterium]|jgi:phosphatidate cytidylyltransferase
MLRLRVLTALALLAILLPALFASVAWPFLAVTIVLIGAAGWEWSRLNAHPGAVALAAGALLVAASLASLQGGALAPLPAWLWGLATLVWVLGGAIALRVGPAGWPRLPVRLRLVLGLLLLWLAWAALVRARQLGINFLLSLLCLVWMADIAAYFSGRAFGRRKLAPAISPGKSWEGVAGGVLGVLLLAAVWLQIDASLAVDGPSLYSLLWQRGGLLLLLPALLYLAAFSVVGDLCESLVKRAAGMKDSSQLLPGHGGVLDRIDALLPVCPLALGLLA